MNIDEIPSFAYYRRAKKLHELLDEYIETAEQIDTGSDILLQENIDDPPPNWVVNVMRKDRARECELQKLIRTAAIDLAKRPLR